MWIDVQQNTDEWLALRCGKVGGSSLSAIMANYGKAFGEPAHTKALEIALEQITGVREESTFTNGHLERGHEQEPIARSLYEQEFFTTVTNGGFFDGGDIGVSPDGLVKTNGMIEIKSHIPKVHFANIKRGTFDPTYKWQLYVELKVSGREWVDYISFCASFPEGRKLYVYRLYAKDVQDEFVMIDIRMDEFRKLVSEKKQVILNGWN